MSRLAPDFQTFEAAYNSGAPQIVTRRIVSDLETPVSAYLKLGARRRYSFLLESVEGGEQLGRYSIIGIKPDVIWRARGDVAEINMQAAADPSHFQREDLPPLESLKRLIAASRIDIPRDAPPMAAGVFGYFGYDMARQMERLPERPPAAIDIPDAVFIRPTITAIFDNIRQEVMLVAPVRPEPGLSARAAYARAGERLVDAASDLAAPLSAPLAEAGAP
ncbi:MAG: anthranilate synthase component I, partial [Amphiplicatus sp.]